MVRELAHVAYVPIVRGERDAFGNTESLSCVISTLLSLSFTPKDSQPVGSFAHCFH